MTASKHVRCAHVQGSSLHTSLSFSERETLQSPAELIPAVHAPNLAGHAEATENMQGSREALLPSSVHNSMDSTSPLAPSGTFTGLSVGHPSAGNTERSAEEEYTFANPQTGVGGGQLSGVGGQLSGSMGGLFHGIPRGTVGGAFHGTPQRAAGQLGPREAVSPPDVPSPEDCVVAVGGAPEHSGSASCRQVRNPIPPAFSAYHPVSRVLAV